MFLVQHLRPLLQVHLHQLHPQQALLHQHQLQQALLHQHQHQGNKIITPVCKMS